MELIKAFLFALRIYFLTAIHNRYFWGVVILSAIILVVLSGCLTTQPQNECENHCYYFFNYGNTSVQALHNCLNECRTR